MTSLTVWTAVIRCCCWYNETTNRLVNFCDTDRKRTQSPVCMTTTHMPLLWRRTELFLVDQSHPKVQRNTLTSLRHDDVIASKSRLSELYVDHEFRCWSTKRSAFTRVSSGSTLERSYNVRQFLRGCYVDRWLKPVDSRYIRWCPTVTVGACGWKGLRLGKVPLYRCCVAMHRRSDKLGSTVGR